MHDATDVLGRRIGAGLLDTLMLAVIFVVAGVAFGGAEASGSRASVMLEGAGALAFAAIVLLYFFLGEVASGQTLGKRLMGVRVVRADGSPAGAGPIAIRTLLRLIDSLPFLYLLGLAVVLFTGQRRQRIGDLAAGTRVVAAAAVPRSRPR